MLIWLNGQTKNDEDAFISASAAAVTLGWGIFTTIGVWASKPFALERHLRRLRGDAAATHNSLDFTDDQIQTALKELLKRNSIAEGYARFTLTRRGDGRWNHDPGSDLSILTVARPSAPPHPLRLALSPYRLEARRPLAGVKSTSYLTHQWVWQEATAQGYDEAVLCNSAGALCECARANLFWVHGDEVRTPALESGCLAGIAREIILEWLAEMGVVSRQGIFLPHELAMADEVFITTAATGPRAVEVYRESYSDATTGDGATRGGALEQIEHRYAAPGPITQLLQSRWQEEAGN